MSDVKLAATARTEFGKGAARRLRRARQVPAVLYGHGTQPMHVALPGHETMLALKHTNALFEIDLDGDTTLAIVKDVQRDVVRQVIEHVDLLIVRRGEMVSVDVPVVVTGESAPGTIHVVETQTLSLEADATKLPSSVEISIEGLAAGAAVTAGDVILPEGSTLMSDAEQVIVVVSEPQVTADDIAADAAVADLAAEQSAASGAANA
ncbi:50S ribosomal protein L25/general stress protein Ctc [Cellulomonas shaoxiangyii]|uniref:Large ribosomal subunit protein bL25 n=1 Tax=Cellulomonas shaoxiangyii TaxID=2566013 RepID=A0A4P7SNE8_9CELL|nr:50S ribosomal protein L25/general stress protein Ctc [Cellulomonas shaoxiangyii]QCB94444.1 50S ribosomal protein L25/general stress protein Ctc [Cellulomonas shaoxiangyii]TGY85151.1 50S ribosomal protein L25/general stress protein Ctc [Cellulomonas shaoxiangyii]